MNIKPLSDRVVIKATKEEDMTASGIFLPETIDKEKKAEGEGVAAGPGQLLKSGQSAQMEVKIGDKVLFEKWGGEEIKVDGKEYKILSADKILAIIEKQF